MKRKLFVYIATLLGSNGETVEKPVKTRWSPGYEGINEAVGSCAASEAWYATGKKVTFDAISVAFKGTVENGEIVPAAA